MKKRLAIPAAILLCAAVLLFLKFRYPLADQGGVATETGEPAGRLKPAEKRATEPAQATAALPPSEPLQAQASVPVPPRQQADPPEPQKFLALKSPSDPVEARLLIRQINGQSLGARYGALFDELGFTPEQRQQFLNLRLDWMEHNTALYRSAIAADPTLRDQSLLRIVSESVSDATVADYEMATTKMFGEENAAAIHDFEEMFFVRGIATRVEREFQSTAFPLTADQAARLTQLIEDCSRQATGRIDLTALDTDALAGAASSFLNPAQVEALRKSATDRKRRAVEAKMPPANARG